MKSLLIIAVTLAVAYGQFPGFGRKPAAFTPFSFSSTAKPYYPPPPAPVYKAVSVAVPRSSGPDAAAETVRSGNEVEPNGKYNFYYETSNGIAAQEEGAPKQFPGNPPLSPIVARGSYSFTTPEGQRVTINWVADENGFQPSGDSIPTPPPIPEAIARSLEFNARNA